MELPFQSPLVFNLISSQLNFNFFYFRVFSFSFLFFSWISLFKLFTKTFPDHFISSRRLFSTFQLLILSSNSFQKIPTFLHQNQISIFMFFPLLLNRDCHTCIESLIDIEHWITLGLTNLRTTRSVFRRIAS